MEPETPAPAEKVTFWHPDALPGVELLHVDGSTRLWTLFHETFVLCSAVDAHSELSYRGRHHLARTGGMMMMEPGELHRTVRSHRPAAFQEVLVEAETFCDALRELGARLPAPHFTRTAAHDPVFFAAAGGLHAAVARGAPALEQQSRLAAVLECVARLHLEVCVPAPHAGRERTVARRVREHIHENAERGVTLDELARDAGMNRFALLRAFRREFGVPPHAYMVQVRVARARALLARGVPPARAAFAAGFSSQSHLGVHFKRVLGLTPSVYARRAGASRPIS